MRIAKVIASRLLSMVPTLVLATLVVFALQRLIPGDAANAIAGEYATAEQIALIRERLGLNQPFLVQYWNWVSGAFTGNLGDSLTTGEPILPLILDRLPTTALVATGALLIAVLIGVPFGVWAASSAGTRIDRFFTGATTVGIAVPNFWLGMLLVLLFATTLHWFPATGGADPIRDPLGALHSAVLPSIALGAVGAAEIGRQVRSAMIENLQADFVRTHRAKGLSQGVIVWRHALKNSSLPLATVIGLQVGTFLGSAVAIEAVFGLSGIGSLVVTATNQRDYPVIQGVVFVLALLVLAATLIVDIAYRVLDPRIR